MIIMSDIQSSIQNDVDILLTRALLDEQMVAFGEDGLGEHGRCDQPQYYKVLEVSSFITFDTDDNVSGIAYIILDGYDAATFGHICSDKNFEICLKNLLKKEEIDPNCVSYSSITEQGDDYVTVDLDVAALLEWS